MIKEYTHICTGTCSRQINIKYDDELKTIESVEVIGGCNGNLKGISSLVKGMKIDDVENKLSGIKCGFKSTSCPDQLAQAMKEIKEIL